LKEKKTTAGDPRKIRRLMKAAPAMERAGVRHFRL
jgi:hypothetical protein